MNISNSQLPKILQLLVFFLLSLVLSSCGGGSKKTTNLKQVAISKITEYAVGSSNQVPIVQDYLNAGVTSVTLDNIDKINVKIRTLQKEDIDSTEELIVVVNSIEVNAPPSVNAGEDKIIQVNQVIRISANATDTDGSIVEYKWLDGGTVLSHASSFEFSSISLGKHTITVIVTDDDGATTSDTIIITVSTIKTINHAPSVQPINILIKRNTKGSITLLGSDIDGDKLVFSIVNKPNHGSVNINGEVLTYAPNNNYTGNDYFSYKANDGKLDSNIATINVIVNGTVDVNNAPVASTIVTNTATNKDKIITLLGSDIDGDKLSFFIVSSPAHGTLTTINGNKAIYRSFSNYLGNDSFSYKVNDGKIDSPIAFVYIQIKDYPKYTKSFTEAKREATEIYLAHQEAFYSGCEYYAVGKKLIPLKMTCGYQTRRNEVRASRIEWEHVVSMWAMAHQFECWKNGGRSNCSHSSDKYREIETNLHNLVPSIGEINGDRSNYEHGIIEGEPRIYGSVDAEVDFKARVFEPRVSVRGDIARMYLYMQQKYGLTLTEKKVQKFQSWSKCDPVDEWEKERNLSIAAIQGDENQFISNYVASDTKDCSDSSGGSSGGSGGGSGGGSSSCDQTKKYCRHMDSCSDAYYYLQQCGRTRLDGDKDGVPCESTLCK